MSIQIPQRCKPSKACGRDGMRPLLYHAYLRNRDDGLWLLATDSYIAVALKVEGETEDGWVPREVLKAMQRDAVRGLVTFERLSETSWRVASADKSLVTVHDCASDVRGAKFPDLEKTAGGLLWGDGPEPQAPAPFGLDAELTARVGMALGGHVRAEVFGPLEPVRFTALDHRGGIDTNRRAMQMPVRVVDRQRAPA